MKKALLGSGLALGLLFALLALRAGLLRAPAREAGGLPAVGVEPARAAQHLAGALRFETVTT